MTTRLGMCAAIVLGLAALAWAAPAPSAAAPGPAGGAAGETKKAAEGAPLGRTVPPDAGPASERDLTLQFAKEAGLTLDEASRLLAEVDRYETECAAWRGRVEANRKAAADARKAGDEQTLKKTLEERAALVQEAAAKAWQHAAVFRGLLTPDQQVAWDAFQLRRMLTAYLTACKIALSDDQAARCRPLSLAAAREKAATEAKGDPGALGRAFTRLRQDVRSQILTLKQKAAFDQTSLQPSDPAPSPAGAPAPGAAK